MTTPILAINEHAAAQALQETTANEAYRKIEQGSQWFGSIKDRNLTAPPGGEADGDAYIVGAAATGTWAGQDGKIALFIGSAYIFVTPREGMAVYIADEDNALVYDGATWNAVGQSYVVPTTQSGTSYTAVLGDAGGYIQFTNAASITFTIPPNSSVAFPTGTVITIEQNNTGVVTIAPGSGVTINSRGALLSTADQYAVAQVKKVAVNTWIVIGDVA